MDSSTSFGEAWSFITSMSEDEKTFEITPANEQMFDRNDPAFQVEVPATDLRERLKARCQLLDKHYLELGYDLYQVAHRHLYREWKYESVSDYVYNELGRTPDWLKGMLDVWSTYQEKLAIPHERFVGIGYTKAKEMRTIINEKNADFWLEKARTSTLPELRKAIRSEKNSRFKKAVNVDVAANVEANMSGAVLISKGDNPQILGEDDWVKKTFNLAPEQFRLLEQMLVQMRSETGSDKDGHNLMMAISEFLMNRGPKAKKGQEQPLLYMRSFEQRYGGNLVWIKNQEQADFLRAAIEANKAIFETGGFSE